MPISHRSVYKNIKEKSAFRHFIHSFLAETEVVSLMRELMLTQIVFIHTSDQCSIWILTYTKRLGAFFLDKNKL